MRRARSPRSWCAGAAVLAVLGASPGLARTADDAGAPPRCYAAGWKPPCTIDLDCTPGDGFEDGPCDHLLPRDCPKLEELDCGDLPTRVELDLCLTAKTICSRATAIGEGAPVAVYEYVEAFDFANGSLAALPGDLVCQGMLSPETDRWCSYVEAVYPDASFLETSVWRSRQGLEGSASEPFARIGVEPHAECRMREGQLLGRTEVGAAGFDCTPEAPLPGPADASLRLSDVAFSDVNHDLYLDAVVTVSWSGGGSASTTMTATLTRLEPDGPLLHLRELGPGFDCAKAGTPTEKRLCGDRKLAVQDLRLSKLYAYLRQDGQREDDAARRSALRDGQRRFLERRNAVCATGDAGPCLALYRTRIAELRELAERERCHLTDVACDRGQDARHVEEPGLDGGGGEGIRTTIR